MAAATERTARLRESLLKTVPRICAERARLLTESMRETEGQPTIIRRAKGLERILRHMTIAIRPDERIVGNQASEPRAAPVFPEFAIQFLVDELDGQPMRPEQRPGDRFLVAEKDEAVLRDIAQWWRGKTVQDYKMNLMPEEVYKAGFEQHLLTLNHGDAGGNGHYILDYPKVLNMGLLGVIDHAQRKLSALKPWEAEDFGKQYFLQAVIIVLRAVISVAERYGQLAQQMADSEPNPHRKAELRQIAEHCKRVPANPARTFWEALQSLWFADLVAEIETNGHSIGFGRFDQYMYPFYEGDIAAGRIKTDEALELIECLWIKSQEINKIRSWQATQSAGGYPMFKNLTLGGQTRDGKPAINELSWLALEATGNLRISSPSVSVRCWNGMPDDYLLKCLETIRIHGGGQPALFNDEAVIPSQLSVGVPLEEAYDYAIDGCVEPCEPGKGMKNGGLFSTLNMLKVLELTLNNGRDPRTGLQLQCNPGNGSLGSFKSVEEILSAFKAQIRFYVRLLVTGINCVAQAFAELTPCPYASALIDDCIENGKDLEWGGGRYNSAGMLQVGTANVGNCLAALKQVVFEKGRLSQDQVALALKTNFDDPAATPSGEDVRRILLRAPKYGNDDDYADLLVKEIFEFTAREITQYSVWTTGARCTTEEGHVTAHVALGRYCGATPDGRKAGLPVSEGVSPTQGTDVRGPVAALKSVTKLNHILCAGGTLLNQKFNPAAFQGLGQLKRLASLVRTYFDLKGMHIQCNVVSADTLRDAQAHPENYPNLLIRIAGYSALFTTLERAIQDEIISRTEQAT